MSTVERPIRAYEFWAHKADGSLTIDTLYIDPRDRSKVWDAQKSFLGRVEKIARLPMTLDRAWAARWLSIRRTAPNATLPSGRLHRSRHMAVPHAPFGPYANLDKIVLHEEHPGDFGGYGRKSGIAEDGRAFIESRLDSSVLDMPEECEEGDDSWLEELEECAQCDAQLGDGDDVWLCLDGGEYYCPEHILLDYRPDSLFSRVGAIRGEHLPEFAWPGGYLIAYYTRQAELVCADCASNPGEYSSDDTDPVESAGVLEGDYEEDYGLDAIPLCEACSRPIDPADRKENQVEEGKIS